MLNNLKSLLKKLFKLFGKRASRYIVHFLLRMPNNNLSNKIVGVFLDNLEDEPIKTRYGFIMHFKHTGYSTGFRKNLITGIYELPYLMMIKRFIRDGDYAIDVGAREGYFSLFMSLLVGKTGLVFAIEPNPENLYFLHRNAETCDKHNIQVIAKAVSDKKTKAPFNYDDGMGPWGSLIDFSYFKTWFKTKKTMEVDVDTLDNLFANVDHKIKFIKIDVEGNELNVFLGAERLLPKHRPYICFEVNPMIWAHLDSSVDSMLSLLKSKGYELFVVEDNRLHKYKNLLQSSFNIFAIHQSQKAKLLNKKGIFYV